MLDASYWAVIERQADGFVGRVPDLPEISLVTGSVEQEVIEALSRAIRGRLRDSVLDGRPLPKGHSPEQMVATGRGAQFRRILLIVG